EDKNTVVNPDGNRGNPNMTIINESGLYSLVLSDASCPLATPQSVLPVLCVLFRVWVFPVKPPQNGRITQTTPFPQSTESTGTTQTKTPALPKAGEAGACCGLTKSNVCAILFIEGCRRPNGEFPPELQEVTAGSGKQGGCFFFISLPGRFAQSGKEWQRSKCRSESGRNM
ncbi:MAG TPA: hypothetical protein H9771_04025, partial [Candidatus Faecalibacterium faecipullorum]|nr:hypothetical protein [Candidatus Faecalibacterium faecipullorum]